MLFLYNFGIYFYSFLVKAFALFSPKAKLFIQGRQDIFKRLAQSIQPGQAHVWFHFASLGEFEQGRPVLEKIKTVYPGKKIVVTFFSPSGYEIRKNYALADAVFYLPLDTAANAKKFIEVVNPEIAIFTKYEFWYHYFRELKNRNIPLFLISGIFRPEQVFFKWYGGFYRALLKDISHFFVQNEESIRLLNSIGLHDVTLSGDTRFDRVFENVATVKKLRVIEDFIQQSPVLIAGSTWPQDEVLIASWAKNHSDWKVILAPHEIGAAHLNQISSLFPEAINYSKIKDQATVPAQVLIIDNIGLLSSLYQYGKIAYIGGGFGVGIHNTLEAAAFGLPVIIGPRYDKFQEAKDLVALGAAISITDGKDLENAFQTFTENPEPGKKAQAYVVEKKGATEGILRHIIPFLN
ncbi:3-deoxy-D-manno-octulosonic acid transferase [Pedobacter sp.]|uniref:3-deoxy-D-manno-octulosonic acid transferase n=1 Tax=Pedobacter sp. TaxID=1411316 RepID=UPI003D7FC85B